MKIKIDNQEEPIRVSVTNPELLRKIEKHLEDLPLMNFITAKEIINVFKIKGVLSFVTEKLVLHLPNNSTVYSGRRIFGSKKSIQKLKRLLDGVEDK
jgi:hypothetical protein